MRTVKILLAVCCVVLLGGLIGCSKKQPAQAPAAAKATAGKPKAIKISMIAKSSTNPVFLSARTGAEAAAKDLSAKYGVAITIDWRTPPTEDGQVQAQRIASAVNEGANVILILLHSFSN